MNTEEEMELTVLTVTRKGVAAAEVASMVGVALSAGLPGMLRRRPVLSGGDSVDTGRTFISKEWLCFQQSAYISDVM